MIQWPNKGSYLKTPPAARAACLLGALVVSGCGGGGTTESSSLITTPVSFAANSIVYGVTNGQASNYEVNQMSATGANVVSVIPNVSQNIVLFALDPSLPAKQVLAADPTGAGLYGIYLSTAFGLSGAQTLVPPTYTYVNSLVITTDGVHVVFSATDSSGVSKLFAVSTVGGTVTELGLADAATVSPADNDTIAYVAPVSSSGNDQVFRRSLGAGASGAPVQLTTDSSNHILPAFSPDGKKVAFWELSTGLNILTVETLSTGRAISLPNPSGLTPQGEAFSGDGYTIVTAGEIGSEGAILTQPVDGSTAPTSILTSASLLGNYGVFWTDANGRTVGSVGGLSSSSRLGRRRSGK